VTAQHVYRVENDIGLGAYKFAYDAACAQHTSHRTPEGRDDGLRCHSDNRFAFASVQQMLAWWNIEELLDLYDKGGMVSVYSVAAAHVTSGGKQVTFVKKYATLVKRFTLQEAQLC